LRSTKKERFDDILENLYSKLLPRAKSLDIHDINISKTIITCQIGELFLRQNFLERRIDGLKLLGDVSHSCFTVLQGGGTPAILNEKQILIQEKKHQMVDKIIEKIREDGTILNEIFSK
jgi:hypothetical protein